MNCEFIEPVNLGTEENPQWHYSKAICEVETIELIQATGTEAEFFINKSISYGDVVLWLFLTLFLIYLIGKTIWNFFWEK